MLAVLSIRFTDQPQRWAAVHRVVAGATHEGLVGERKYAAATTQAILDVVSSVRNNRPLVR